jgi:hypothetical protein
MTDQAMTPGAVLVVLDRCAEIMHDEAAPVMQDEDIAADLRDGSRELIQAFAAVAALIARNAELEADNKALRERSKRLLDAYDYSANEFESAQAAEGVRELIDAARAEADHG